MQGIAQMPVLCGCVCMTQQPTLWLRPHVGGGRFAYEPVNPSVHVTRCTHVTQQPALQAVAPPSLDSCAPATAPLTVSTSTFLAARSGASILCGAMPLARTSSTGSSWTMPSSPPAAAWTMTAVSVAALPLTQTARPACCTARCGHAGWLGGLALAGQWVHTQAH